MITFRISGRPYIQEALITFEVYRWSGYRSTHGGSVEGCPPGSPYHLRRHPLCALLRFWRIHMLVQFPVPTYSDRLLYSRVGSMLCTKNLLKYSTSFWLGGSFRKLSTHTSITCCTSSICVKYSFYPFFAPCYLRGGCCRSLACGWGFWGYS